MVASRFWIPGGHDRTENGGCDPERPRLLLQRVAIARVEATTGASSTLWLGPLDAWDAGLLGSSGRASHRG